MTSFETDIRPLFRDEDVESMAFAFDMSSYEEVREHAQEIHARLATEENVELFRAWIDDRPPC